MGSTADVSRMKFLFDPASIAIVGASPDPSKPSGAVLRNLRLSRYSGRLYPVNPRWKAIDGVTVYPSILDLPEAPDLVVIVIPAEMVAEVLEDSGRLGVKVALIGVSGFAEAGELGKQRQARLVEIRQKYGIRICGPNCNGVYNVSKGIPIGYNSSHGVRLHRGRVAIVSHSSACLGSLAHRSVRLRLGLSYLAGMGNEADWEMCDFLQFCLEDEVTHVIGIFVEGLRDGERFLELVSRAHQMKKGIVALKLGRSRRGAIVVQAHTDHMAGAAEVYEAAFRQYGVASTDSMESFLGALQLTASPQSPNKGRVMAMASSGAGAELLADKAADYGITLAEISEDVRSKFPERRFAYLLTNPFDTTGQARDQDFLASVCSLFAADDTNDCLVLFLTEIAVRDDFAQCFCRAISEQKKLGIAIVGEVGDRTLEILHKHDVPVFDSIDVCFSALRAAIRAAGYAHPMGLVGASAAGGSVVKPTARQGALKIFGGCHSTFLPEQETKRLLTEYGFACARSITVRSFAEARTAARQVGFPVILKAVPSQFVHKDELGLVSPPVYKEDSLDSAYRGIEEKAQAFAQESDLLPVSVEEFVPHDFEAILGVKQDPVFGPVLLFGQGGIFTEILGDYAVRLARPGHFDSIEMVSSVKSYEVLRRATSAGKIDLLSLYDSIRRLAILADDLKDYIAVLDINPIALLPARAGGVIVLDAKAVPSSAKRDIREDSGGKTASEGLS